MAEAPTEFERFFPLYLKKLETVQIPEDQLPNSENASWDRKAAWMFLVLLKGMKKQEGKA